MELKDTIALMTSDDYRERFKAEYLQLKIRHKKLCAIMDKWSAGTLPFTPACPYGLLLEQSLYMEQLLYVLKRRARLEGIDLED